MHNWKRKLKINQLLNKFILKIKRKIPLHLQILIALLAGAVFGIIFNVNHSILNITAHDSQVQIQTEKSDSLQLISYDSKGNVIQNILLSSDQKQKLIKQFKKIKSKAGTTITFSLKSSTGEILKSIGGVTEISPDRTVATEIKPLGDIFIRLLSLIAIPLVIATLITGAASLDDVKKLGKIGIRTFLLYIATTALAITIGLVIANTIQPGNRVELSQKQHMIGSVDDNSAENITENLDVNIVQFVVEMIPKNPFEAISSGNMLQIVFFVVFFGVALTFVPKEKAEPVKAFFDGAGEVIIKMVNFAMKYAPIGVFALIASTIADFGYEILSTLFWYILCVVLGLLLHTTVVYGAMVKLLGKTGILRFFKGIRNAQVIAFSTSSSASTLPVTFECVEENLGVSKKIAGFVLPLGATLNMDGTALYQGVAAVFIAQIYGIDLGLSGQLTIILTAVLASIGTAPVPGVGIIMLVMILQSVHIPPQGIALILGVDRILDMLRTITNVTGDAAVSVVVAASDR